MTPSDLRDDATFAGLLIAVFLVVFVVGRLAGWPIVAGIGAGGGVLACLLGAYLVGRDLYLARKFKREAKDSLATWRKNGAL